jgi:NTP pyrophosphatase (non-canonical NTP hydrolase)
MDIRAYQAAARATAIYPREPHLMYPALGLCGEAGEVAEKIKKVLRDKNNEWSPEDRMDVAKELGDVMWYVSNLASDLKIDLGEVLEINLKKLQDRAERGVLRGSGDER